MNNLTAPERLDLGRMLLKAGYTVQMTRRHASGCPDPTAYKALKGIARESADREKVVQDYIHIVKALADGLGLEVQNRIHLRDTKTGKEYR